MTTIIDQDAIRELELWIDNTEHLYRQAEAIRANLVRKIRKGIYDPTRAPTLWRYLVDEAARHYCQELGGTVRGAFPAATRQAAAVQMAADTYDDLVEQAARADEGR